jgi:energy-converting hydrogenase Eha subunit H
MEWIMESKEVPGIAANVMTETGWFRRLVKSLPHYYSTLALIFFNCLLLFIIVNLIADAALEIHSQRKKAAAQNGTPWSYRRFHDSLTRVYPGLANEQISKLMTETRHLRQEYESYTEFRESPCNGEFVNVDSRGYRPVKNQGPWPPTADKFCIFVFGGSTAFGYGVADDMTVASRLQDLLASDYGIAANVYNLGRGSYFSVQERVLFENLLLAGYVPDMAIFIDGLNDLTLYDGVPARTRNMRAFMNEGETSLVAKVIRGLPLMKAIRLGLSSHDTGEVKIQELFKMAPASNQASIMQGVAKRYFSNIKLTEAIAGGYGVTPVFVWQPVPVYAYDRKYCIFGEFDYEGQLPALKPGYDFMARTFAEHPPNKNVIWAADIQQNLKMPLYVDAVHYSPEMTNILAKFILDTVMSRGLYEESLNRRQIRTDKSHLSEKRFRAVSSQE